jgi:hypothetical protein
VDDHAGDMFPRQESRGRDPVTDGPRQAGCFQLGYNGATGHAELKA